ncbi:MAG: hypothetical protein EP335_08820 [Alphaproteobacteria bacterium]|nr:MAG: hypothetical protein EP335_08820 [Alphaproteobacteria bacterium]
MRRSFRARLLALALPIAFFASPAMADDITAGKALQDIEELRSFSLSLWPRFRDTNQQYYTYVRAATDFRAYLDVCKRHDLNVHLESVNRLAVRYLEEIVTAHYEEPEWAKLEGKTDAEKKALITDFANDVLAFEYGLTLVAFREKAKATGLSDKQYCESIVREYQNKYIALLATARRQLESN